MEYQTIVHNVTTLLDQEERDIEARQAEVDTAQALLDRRRRALKRKRGNFEKLMAGWRTLDVEVISGKPSRSDASGDEDEPDEEPREPAGGEAA